MEKRGFSRDTSAGLAVSRLLAHAKKSPYTLAIAARAGALTFGELDARSHAVATALRAKGIGRDALVGLCLGRTPAMIVGALGILRAGGAYLPLDPAYPAARIAQLLADAEVSVVVADATQLAQIAWSVGQRIVLDEAAQIVEGGVTGLASAPLDDAQPSDLAYVIYTSGSTGQPKGVEVTHANLANLIEWHQRAFAVTANDRASQVAKVSFDAAVWEIWPYLAAGASVHLADDEITAHPEALRDWLVAEKITLGFAPTPVAELLLRLAWPAGTALRALLTGADTLHTFPPAGLPFQLINNYGPTECAVVATSGVMPVSAQTSGLPTIGRPIDNVQLLLLNDSRQPVAVGEPGEIFLGGAGVARGYRNRPDLTAERFVTIPANAGGPETRFFKTGDLGKILPSGEIAFLGRLDDQVKVRGYRIEPNEISAALNQHPSVAQSIVIAANSTTGEARLVAYVVAKNATPVPRGELRDFLGARLPEYMVPATFVLLDALPLTPNGKVDRAALPAPDAANSTAASTFTAAQTEAELVVAEILAPLLKLAGPEQVDVGANFFELGGHSLLGTQLIARVRETFDINLSLRALFEAPTVLELAAEIERLLVAKLASLSDEEVQQQLAKSEPLTATSTR